MFNGFSSEALAAVIFFATLILYRQQRVFISLLKLPLRLAEPAPVERATLPAHTAALLDGARPELEAAGFAYQYTEAAAPPNALDARPLVHADVYWNAEKSTLAVARIGEPYTGQAVSVLFLTAFAGGKRLTTSNRILWGAFPVPDDYQRQDACADTLQDQWTFHLDALARETAAPISDLQAVLQLDRGMARIFAHMQALGWIREEAPGRFRFTARGAWQYARQQRRGLKAAHAALKRPYRPAHAPDPEALRYNEMNGFAMNTELAAQPLPQWMKAVMFGLTLLVSALLFGRAITFTGAAALLLVILVHEFGHLIAMRAFGFRNLSILFVPFFGALAIGHKEHVKPWQEAVILLAGPVPGLVAAFALAQLPVAGFSPTAADFLRMTFWFALLINLFNLLPIGILDGGKLFQLAALARFPRVRAVFGVAGAAVGLAYALVNHSPVLAIAMAMLLMGARYEFRAAKAIAAIRAQAKAQGMASQLGREEAVALLAQYLARPEFSQANIQGTMQRTTIAMLAYPRLLQGVPRLGSGLGVMAAHATAFFVPLLLAAALVQQPGSVPILRQAEAAADARKPPARPEAEGRAARAQFMARYAATRDAQEKWRMLNEAQYGEDDEKPAFELDEQWAEHEREALLPALPADHPAKLQELLAKAMRGGPEAAGLVLAAVDRLTRGDGGRIASLDDDRFSTLLDAFRILKKHGAPQVLAAQDALLDAGWARMETLARQDANAPPTWRQKTLASTAAQLAFAGGNPARAEVWMARKASCGCNEGHDVEQGWFRLDLGRADEAQELAARALAAPGVKGYARSQWLALAGWVEMSRGRPREADGYFTQALQGGKEANEPFNVIAWLLGIVQGTPQPPQQRDTWVGDEMVDHLAALEGYDPQQAARYRAELAPGMTQGWKAYAADYLVPNERAGGWGRERSATLARVLDVRAEGGAAQ